MSKKHHTKPGNQNATAGLGQPSDHCNYDVASIHSVRIERSLEDDERYSEQKKFWGRQITVAKVLNWVTAIAASFAAIYALLTFLQWRQAGHAFRLDQRPWVGIVDQRVSQFSADSDYVVEIQLNNSGKSPAFRAWYWDKSRIAPAPQAGPVPENMDEGRKHVSIGSIPPQGPRIATLRWKWDEWKPAYADVINRTSLVSVYGEIVYFDADSGEHRTQFCFYMKDAGLPSQRLLFCDRWNEMN